VTFREAIAATTFNSHDPLPAITNNRFWIADAVLAMPEMEAIREALFDAYHPVQWVTADGPGGAHRRNMEDAGHLPKSVIDWVLEEDQ
jgi:hypothetical protein